MCILFHRKFLGDFQDLNLSELAGEVHQSVLDGGSLVDYTHAVEQVM